SSADLAKEQAGDVECELTQRDDDRYEVALPLKDCANPKDSIVQTESDVNMSEAVSARPPGSTSKAVEKKETEPEAVDLPGFEHCQVWDTLVPEVKSHLASMTDSPEGDPPQAAD